jgi:hypothetical protein
MTTFFASDAGIQMVMEKINRTVADVTPVNQTLGDGTNIRTGTRTDTTPQNVRQGGAVNSPPDGYMINVGSGGFSTLPYYAEITATGPDNSVVELEAKLGRLEMN